MLLLSFLAVILAAALLFTWKPIRARGLARERGEPVPNRIIDYLLQLLWYLGATVVLILVMLLAIIGRNHS